MDKEKDTKNTGIGSKKDILLSDTANATIPQIFERDNSYYLIYKKAERIVSAIYLISNFFSDNEPMKWNVRKLGAHLLDDVMSLSTNSTDSNQIKNKIILTSQELSSLFNIACVSGAVSDMNFEILKREFGKLIKDVEMLGKSSQNLNSSIFPRDFFNVGELEKKEELSYPQIGLVHKAREDFNLNQALIGAKGERVFGAKNNLEADSIKDIENSNFVSIKNGAELKRNRPPESSKNDYRKNTILNLVRKNGEINIKDVTTIITGCSEKTVQRELAGLVKEGVLKKAGERRWSRYSFV